MDKLFTLLELQRAALEAQSRSTLLHIIVNETRKIVPYTQAVFFVENTLGFHLEKISGNAALEQQSGYATALKSSVKRHLAEPDDKIIRSLSKETDATEGAILLFKTDGEGLLGGLWLEHDKPYNDAEIRILEELCATYSTALALWTLRGKGKTFRHLPVRNIRFGIAACLFILALFPTRLSVTAPAEIVARKSEIVSVPFDGLIEQVHVEPGDKVNSGDLLVTMDHATLQAQMDMAQQEMSVVESSLSRMQRESLASPDKKPNLSALQEQIEAKKIAFDYAKEQKDRSEIRAKRDGVAVFSDANGLRGRPVATGDKIMSIADPADYELLVRVPADAMTPISQDAKVRFFLNVSPLSGREANIRSIGYQASPDPDGLLTYKIMAKLPQGVNDLRIGWKGTAHIDGGWTVLSYKILRRPLIMLRNMLGL